MALIKCPECGKQISDKAHQCIHCGYPLDEVEGSTSTAENNYKVVLEDVAPANKVRTIKVIMDYTGISLKKAKDIAEEIPSVIKTGLTLEEAQKIGASLSQEKAKVSIIDSSENKVPSSTYEEKLVCPKCHSTLVTTGAKGFSLLSGFLGSGKTVNRCGKCGYKWTPRK